MKMPSRIHYSPASRVREFHWMFGLPVNQELNDDEIELRIRLIEEETRELVDALRARDWAGVAKESADVVYVAYGTTEAAGIDLDEAIVRVHESNMTKLDWNGRPIVREDGKILKSDRYQEPDMSTVPGVRLRHQSNSLNELRELLDNEEEA